jgi:dihydropteroate synthase
MLTLNCKGRLLVMDKPLVMGIVNVTPDSFYSGSRATEISAVLRKVEDMLMQGAAILDIGGQSTRPGSDKISDQEELERVVPVIKAVSEHFPDAIISIDTYYSRVARESIEAGASLVNDISAGSMDSEMLKTVSIMQVPYVLMHMRGTPQTMQNHAESGDIVKEVLDFLILKKNMLLGLGIKDVIIDPGFGFGKTLRQNFELLRNLTLFKTLNSPILLGMSRKSSVYRTLNTSAEDALNGTTVLNTIGLLNGANILRVHDVKEAVEAVKLLNEYTPK